MMSSVMDRLADSPTPIPSRFEGFKEFVNSCAIGAVGAFSADTRTIHLSNGAHRSHERGFVVERSGARRVSREHSRCSRFCRAIRRTVRAVPCRSSVLPDLVLPRRGERGRNMLAVQHE
jgi:hypothetical protein